MIYCLLCLYNVDCLPRRAYEALVLGTGSSNTVSWIVVISVIQGKVMEKKETEVEPQNNLLPIASNWLAGRYNLFIDNLTTSLFIRRLENHTILFHHHHCQHHITSH